MIKKEIIAIDELLAEETPSRSVCTWAFSHMYLSWLGADKVEFRRKIWVYRPIWSMKLDKAITLKGFPVG